MRTKTKQRWALVSNLFQLGWSIEKIAKATGHSAATIYNDLKRFGQGTLDATFPDRTPLNERINASWQRLVIEELSPEGNEPLISALQYLLGWDIMIATLETATKTVVMLELALGRQTARDLLENHGFKLALAYQFEASETRSLYRSVSELKFSVRTANCLANAEIEFVYQLVTKTDAEMLAIKNFGPKSLNEIRRVLTELGLSLNMVLPKGFRPSNTASVT